MDTGLTIDDSIAPRKPAIRTVAEMGLPAFSGQCFIECLCWSLWAWSQEHSSYALYSVQMASVWARS